MSSRSPALLLLLGLPFACATPAARPPAAALGPDAKAACADASLSPSSAAAPVRVDGPTAKRLVAEGARLVDVRAVEFYALGHIEGAINIPVAEVAARAAEIGGSDVTIVLYCRTGAGSAKAAGILTGLGYQRVYDLGSYLNWGEGAPPATPLPVAPGPKS